MIQGHSQANTSSSSDNHLNKDQSYSPTEKKHEANGSARRRRTKKDSDAPRIHCCKHCDKSYLSYPALYTHLKQKHPEAASRKAEDHPRETESDASLSHSHSVTHDILASLAKNLPTSEVQTARCVSYKDIQDLVYWEILLDLAENENGPLSVSQYYSDLRKAFEKGDIPTSEEMSADAAFIWFTREVKEHLSFEQMKIAILFIHNFRRMLSTQAEVISAKQLVEQANLFICECLPQTLRRIESLSERNWIVALSRNQNIEVNMIQMMLSFCDWLYARNLTDDKLMLTQQGNI